jgi:predicted naringenin-chalcone synthase
MSDSEKDKIFDERFKQRKQKIESDARIQRKRAMTPDEKRLRAIELQTEKHMKFYRENNIPVSEESVRRELANRAERSERRKDGE